MEGVVDTGKLVNTPESLLKELLELRTQVYAEGLQKFRSWYPDIRRLSFIPSALNLAFYLALRRRDLRGLQRALKPLGLSSLGLSEAGAIDNPTPSSLLWPALLGGRLKQEFDIRTRNAFTKANGISSARQN